MSSKLIKPMTLIRETWNSFLKTWDATVRLSAWYIAISAGTAVTVYLRNGQLGTQFIGSIIQIITMLASLYLSVKLYQLIFATEDNKPIASTNAQQTWKIIGQVLVSVLLIVIPVMLFIGLIFASLALGASSKIGLTITGLLIFAFFIATVYLIGVRLSFAQNHIIDQAKGSIEAYKYSWKITKNLFWPILGRTVLGGIVFGALIAVLSITAIIIVSIVSGVDIASAMAQKNPSPAISSISELIQGIIMAAILPLFYIFKVKLYRDVEKAN